MAEPVGVQWFPGHMAKTRRLITESLKLVDAVAEMIDARIPVSSRNPELAGIVANKPRIILMNKADAADPAATKAWLGILPAGGRSRPRGRLPVGPGIERLFAPRAGDAASPSGAAGGQRDGRQAAPGDGGGHSQRREILLHQPYGRRKPG